MSNDGYRRTTLGNHGLHAETLMLSYGYDPKLSEGSVKPPVFLTSTFTFPSADAGREFFDIATGRTADKVDSAGGLVYARYNHPNAQIVEERLALFENAESGAVFASGMAAVNAVATMMKAGDHLVCSHNVYVGVPRLFNQILVNYGLAFTYVDSSDLRALEKAIRRTTRYVWVETPTNPLMSLTDIAAAAKRLAGVAVRTPLINAPVLDEHLSARVFLKAETLQHTGSFKVRGAFTNLLTRMIPAAGVVAASGGNHGIAVAYAARQLGKPASIFVPTVTSPRADSTVAGLPSEAGVRCRAARGRVRR